MKNFICIAFLICLFTTKSLCQQEPCPGPMDIQNWDDCTTSCGSTSDFWFYVYTNRPNYRVNYTQGFLNQSCFELPAGWTYVSSYADNVTIGSIEYQRHKVTLRPTQFTGNGVQCRMRTVAFCQGPNIPLYSPWATFTIHRSVSTNARNLPSNSTVCSGNPLAISLSTQPGDMNFSWSTSSNTLISGGQGTATVQLASTGNGNSYLTVNFVDGCTNNLSRNTLVYSGLPQVSWFTVNSQTYNYSANGQICTGSNQNINAGASLGTTGYNWSITSGNAYNANFSSYGNSASFSPYGSGYFNLALNVSNSCGSTTSNISFDAYTCSARYSVYPNPARDNVNVEFEKIEDGNSLPDQIDVLSENSTDPIKSVDVQQAYQSKKLKSGNVVEINTEDLPRGTYYLRIKNGKRKEKPVESVRFVLE